MDINMKVAPLVKKILVACLFSTLSSIAVADGNDDTSANTANTPQNGKVVANNPNCPVPCMLREGFYAGAQVGYNSYKTGVDTVILIFGIPFSVHHPKVSAIGYEGGLFAGYGTYLYPVFYLGIEGFINHGNVRTTFVDTDYAGFDPFTHKSRFRASTSYGLSLMPGFRLSNASLFYVRAGYNWTNMRSLDVVNDRFFIPLPVSTRVRTNQAGWHAGVGIETLLWENVSVRGEYTYFRHNSFESDFGVKYKPSSTQFNVGVVYHFC